MRKPQSQPSLASLTPADREQLAEWLRQEDYNVVLERVVKPRPEGLDLDVSKKPLQTFYAKVALMDLINARLPENKRFTLAQFECLASADIHLLTSGEQEKLAETHDQILRTTADLAASAQSANELATLQRLADFPARAAVRAQLFDYRAQRMEFDRNKDQRAQAKAHREAEMHTHKISLDLRKFGHKLDMDTFHQHIATERLDLQKISLALREKQHEDRFDYRGVKGSSLSNNSDDFDPNPVKNPDRTSMSCEDNSDRPKIRILVDEDGKPFTRFPTPNPLPYEIYLKNRAYTKKLLAGLVDPLTGKELDEPNNHVAQIGSLPPVTPTDAAPADPHPQSNPANPVIPVQNPQQKSQILSPESTSPLHLETRTKKLETPPETPLSSPSALIPSPTCPAECADLTSTVNAYTIRRADEYWSHRRTHSDPPRPRQTTPEYITAFRHCPCGQGSASIPCPIHESAEFGPFPNFFWKLSPHSVDYAAALRERNLPYRNPTEFL